MSPFVRLDHELLWLVAGVAGTLGVSTGVGFLLQRGVRGLGRATVMNLNARIRSWWVMCAVFAVAMLTGGVGSVVFFGLISLLALREFVTLLPTGRSDHRSLVWVFYAITPLQYWLVAVGWYELFSIFIPVGAFLFLASRNALTGDTERFLERTAVLPWGVMMCVYCVSHVPALLNLRIPGHPTENVKLLVFFVTVVQISDAFQYVWGKWLGRTPIAPTISPSKTLEGLIGGIGSATLAGTGIWWLTPFTPWQAAGVSLIITLMGFAGGLTMSAIKRDRGVKDYGTLIDGHGGVLDRIDSICFAAPVFFHLIRFLFT